MESLTKSRMDDLLSAEVGKHDYDWLLTPPGTPLFSHSEASDNPTSKAAPRSRSSARSVSTGKASRLSVCQSEKDNSAKPARSSSTSRSSMSNTYSSSTYASNSSRTAVLNTSTASVTSKPSTPGNRPTIASAARTTPLTASQSAPSRSSTPVKSRPSSTSAADRPRPSQNSRPATPTVRPQVPSIVSNASSNAAAARSNSRPSTPTRRATAAASAPALTRSASVGHVLATGNRNNGPAMRPSSPAPRVRAQAPPVAPPELEVPPPNPRTKHPERAISASRQRPGAALPTRANSNSETIALVSSIRRQSSSPIITRGRLQENSSNARLNNKANEAKVTENKKPMAPESAVRRPSKPASPTENTASGRSISKKSMDMVLKHMDIKQSMGGIRGSSLFPQSIRSTAQKGRPGHSSELAIPTSDKVVDHTDDKGISVAVISDGDRSNGIISSGRNGSVLGNGDVAVRAPNEPVIARVSKMDIYESSRYDAMLLKEDSKNMSWLHSIEDKCEQSCLFDHKFGLLPEPFGLL